MFQHYIPQIVVLVVKNQCLEISEWFTVGDEHLALCRSLNLVVPDRLVAPSWQKGKTVLIVGAIGMLSVPHQEASCLVALVRKQPLSFTPCRVIKKPPIGDK